MIAVTIEGMSPALSQVVLQIGIEEIWQNNLQTPLRLIAPVNFSLRNYSCEFFNFTGTVGKVELISTFTTAVCQSWNVSDKYTWGNAGDLKQLSMDPDSQ